MGKNDAERAVRAALGIQRALAEFNAKNTHVGAGRPELVARIGVETGAVRTTEQDGYYLLLGYY